MGLPQVTEHAIFVAQRIRDLIDDCRISHRTGEAVEG
jgi:hypothetical protein